MSKFKLGNIVARVVLGESWRDRNNTDYLYAGFVRYLPESYPPEHSRTASDDDDDDDGSSIISTSSTATFNDEPGTGRTVDTFIFQPVGRWIERAAMRFTISSLHPAHIAQYIEASESHKHFFPLFDESRALHDAIDLLCSERRNGSTIVAGMKGLVKQTQSNSIHRSASALAALIRLSLSEDRREVYANVSRIEPIFHLETHARSLTCSHPEKKWFLLLVKLAKETLIAIRRPSFQFVIDLVLGKEVLQLWPLPETAQNLRQRLIRALQVYRLSGLDSLDNTIGEACAICAEANSTSIYMFARGNAYMHILETVYFTVIFILRSIIELYDFARITANRHAIVYTMVLRTIAYWIDAFVYQCLFASHRQGRCDFDLLKTKIAFCSLALKDGDTGHTLLPESFKHASYAVWEKGMFPRRHREVAEWDKAPPIQSLLEVANQRTRRLLRSFNDLEREVFGCSFQTNISTSQFEIDADPYSFFLQDFGDEWWNNWKSTLERAQNVQVSENVLTEEFREARRIGLEVASLNNLQPEGWACYQLHRLSRHKFGQYLRSNMDWDWDLGSCMRRLFKVESTLEGRPPAAQCFPETYSEIDVDEEQGATWRLEAQGSLPKEVQIAYKTETGETQYMSFAPAYPSPRHCPAPERFRAGLFEEESLEPTVVQQDLGYRKASSCEEQEIEHLATSASSSDASPPKACDETPVESYYASEGKEPAYDVGFDGVRVGGEDSISICSLD